VCRLRVRSWDASSREVAGEARGWVRHALTEWSVPDPDGEIALIVTELVTNSLRHAGPPIRLTLAVADGFVDLTVTDCGSDPQAHPVKRAPLHPRSRCRGQALPTGAVPVHAHHPSLAVVFSDAPHLDGGRGRRRTRRINGDEQPVEGVPEGGRGLFLVDALASSWAIDPTSQGSRVWVRRPLSASWPFRQTCTCSPDHAAAVPLASGHVTVPTPLTLGPASVGLPA
jgi:hypothetical protein